MVQLAHRDVALQGIHAAESDERLRMLPACLRDHGVRHARTARRGLSVPREQHRHHVHGLVIGSQLLDRPADDLRPEVALGRLDVALHRHVEPVRRRQVDVEIDRPHGHGR